LTLSAGGSASSPLQDLAVPGRLQNAEQLQCPLPQLHPAATMQPADLDQIAMLTSLLQELLFTDAAFFL
jgi:hypothetical protein